MNFTQRHLLDKNNLIYIPCAYEKHHSGSNSKIISACCLTVRPLQDNHEDSHLVISYPLKNSWHKPLSFKCHTRNRQHHLIIQMKSENLVLFLLGNKMYLWLWFNFSTFLALVGSYIYVNTSVWFIFYLHTCFFINGWCFWRHLTSNYGTETLIITDVYKRRKEKQGLTIN